MKILIATDTYYPSVNGAAYFTYRLANCLKDRGHEIYIMCPSMQFKNTISNEAGVIVYGIRSIYLPVYQNFRFSPLFLSKKYIKDSIIKISPDIIHIQNHFMIGKGAALFSKKLGIPVIGTNHFMPENLIHFLHLPKFAESWLINFGWKQCIDIFKELNLVTAPTKTAANLFKKAGFNKEVTPISNGIDLNIFKSSNDGEYLKEKYKLPINIPILLFVGRMDKEKKVDEILFAMSKIIKTKDAHLVLAGKGKEKHNLEMLTKKLNLDKHVTFTGFIPDIDLPNLYNVADLFVIAGIAELQSIVTMEAMASGLPIVAVNAVALPELVHDGVNGYLFTAGDCEDLANKILIIISNNKMSAQMSKESLEIIKNHDLNIIINKYVSIYNKVIDSHVQNTLV